MTRRRFLVGSALAATGGLGGVGYVRLFEPRWLDVGRHEVPLGGATAGQPLTLLQLSDFHASPVVPLDYIDHAVRLGLAENPDLICLTGDYFTWTLEEPDCGRYARILAQLSQRAPTFACLGNHDGGRWAGSSHGYKETTRVQQLLSDAGVTLLHNASRLVELHGRRFNLAAELQAQDGGRRVRPAYSDQL